MASTWLSTCKCAWVHCTLDVYVSTCVCPLHVLKVHGCAWNDQVVRQRWFWWCCLGSSFHGRSAAACGGGKIVGECEMRDGGRHSERMRSLERACEMVAVIG